MILTPYHTEPTTQREFTEQIVQNITEVEPGHQCYKISSLPSTASAGTNATIQLAYWADYEGENGGKNETFYACADIVSPVPSFLNAAPINHICHRRDLTNSTYRNRPWSRHPTSRLRSLAST